MMPEDSKNVYGNPRLQSPNFTLKMSYLKYFSVSFGRCNLKVSAIFLESIEHCCAFGFLGTCQPLPYRRFKRTVGVKKIRKFCGHHIWNPPCRGGDCIVAARHLKAHYDASALVAAAVALSDFFHLICSNE